MAAEAADEAAVVAIGEVVAIAAAVTGGQLALGLDMERRGGLLAEHHVGHQRGGLTDHTTVICRADVTGCLHTTIARVSIMSR